MHSLVTLPSALYWLWTVMACLCNASNMAVSGAELTEQWHEVLDNSALDNIVGNNLNNMAYKWLVMSGHSYWMPWKSSSCFRSYFLFLLYPSNFPVLPHVGTRGHTWAHVFRNEKSGVAVVSNYSSVLWKVFKSGLTSASGNETEGDVHTTNVSILLSAKKKFLIPFPSPDRTRKV